MMAKHEELDDDWDKSCNVDSAAPTTDVAGDDPNLDVDMLIQVATTKNEWYIRKYRTCFVLDDETLMPTEKDDEHLLWVRVQRFPLDPHL